LKTVSDIVKEIDLLEEMALRLLHNAQENVVILVSTLKEIQCLLNRVRTVVQTSDSVFNREETYKQT